MMSKMMAAFIGLALFFSAHQSFAAEKINFTVDWVLSGIHAGYFVAKEKGFYSQNGLDVSISRGFGSGDTIKRVATGSADFGLADTGAVIAARANDDIPVRIVAMIYDQATLGVIYRMDSGIRKPKDLEGRTLARSASGASVNMFPGFLKANNIDRSKIKEVVVDAATFLPLLMSERADAILDQGILIGKYARKAEEFGKKLDVMLYSDYGLPAYGTAIITQDKRIADDPDLIRRFVEASLRGVAYALDNPEEAVDILLKNHPEIDRLGAMDELRAMKRLGATDDVLKNGLGHIRKDKMERTIETVTDALSIKEDVTADDVYADGFLPEAPIFFGK